MKAKLYHNRYLIIGTLTLAIMFLMLSSHMGTSYEAEASATRSSLSPTESSRAKLFGNYINHERQKRGLTPYNIVVDQGLSNFLSTHASTYSIVDPPRSAVSSPIPITGATIPGVKYMWGSIMGFIPHRASSGESAYRAFSAFLSEEGQVDTHNGPIHCAILLAESTHATLYIGIKETSSYDYYNAFLNNATAFGWSQCPSNASVSQSQSSFVPGPGLPSAQPAPQPAPQPRQPTATPAPTPTPTPTPAPTPALTTVPTTTTTKPTTSTTTSTTSTTLAVKNPTTTRLRDVDQDGTLSATSPKNRHSGFSMNPWLFLVYLFYCSLPLIFIGVIVGLFSRHQKRLVAAPIALPVDMLDVDTPNTATAWPDKPDESNESDKPDEAAQAPVDVSSQDELRMIVEIAVIRALTAQEQKFEEQAEELQEIRNLLGRSLETNDQILRTLRDQESRRATSLWSRLSG